VIEPEVGPSVPSDEAGPALRSNIRQRSMIIGLVCAVVVIAAVLAGIAIFNKASAALSAGSGTATITWTPAPDNGNAAGNPPQSFRGTIGGHTVSGVANFASPDRFNPLGGPSGIENAQILHYRGTFAGKPFVLGLSIGAQPGVAINSQQGDFVIKGTYDGQRVNAILGPPVNPNQSSPPIPFHGTIGKWTVVGTIHLPAGTSQKQIASATYSISS